MSDERRTSSRREILGMSGLALASTVAGTTIASADEGTKTETGTAQGDGSGQDGDREEVLEMISDWEEKQRTEAKNTMDKYGVPEGITERRLLWYDAGPWLRIEMFRDATRHNFPIPHPDFFEQFIDYQVPPDKAEQLMEFDGSVFFERTEGVLSARCHTEWANFLALNLAHDIVTEEKTVKQARRAYGEKVLAFQNGESPPYTQGFQFELPEGPQRDRGVRIIHNGEVQLREDATNETPSDGGKETPTDRG